ncbi:bet1-like SNARE 1-1 [Hibiscus syriacus]|uniref:Bet1-like SNARE 1-1 n=1 Tax=Hibiscus syriacus TaxID=106335 RepID=A0A6A3C523_HIBSY|nr:bet1-like SNARE 1-1 [Hibiscus syriacus]
MHLFDARETTRTLELLNDASIIMFLGADSRSTSSIHNFPYLIAFRGVGLKLDDAVAFWKAEFAPKFKWFTTHDYTPYSYQKLSHQLLVLEIIMVIPIGISASLYFTPYISYNLQDNEENLRVALVRMGVSSRGVEDVMDKVHNMHYQLACTLTFEVVHVSSCDVGVNHPNQYFIDSQRIQQSKV